MPRDLSIVNEYHDAYVQAYYAWNPYYPLADRDLRFYLGDQWDAGEKQKLFQDNRNAFVFNRARSIIDLIDGYQRKNRLSSVVIPIENSDQQTADQLSKLLLYVMQYGGGYEAISDCFSGALKTGWNLCTVYMDYVSDPVDGDIRFGREPYSGFITDPYFTRLDFSDLGYMIRRKYLNVNQAASLLPGQEKEIYQLHKIGWSRDDKFTWLPYQQQPNGEELIAFNEYYKQGFKSISVLVDMESGEFLEFDGDRTKLEDFREQYPEMKMIKQAKRFIEKHIICNEQYMRTETNQYGLNEYPFTPFVATFQPESDFWELKVQSLMRPMIDPQREANRRRSQMIDILDSQINSGWLAEEDSVINPRSLFQTAQGKVIWKKKNSGAVERLQPAQIPPSMFQLQDLFDRDMREIVGVNDAMFGVPQSGNESGLLNMMRQASSVTGLQTVFDKLRFAQKNLSSKVLKLIMSWSPNKIRRILGEEPSDAFFAPMDVTKFDVTVQEGVLTDTQQQMYFRQLMDLKALTDQPSASPITADMLIKAAPIQGKTNLMPEVMQNQQKILQAAQSQQQLQNQLVGSQVELAKSTSISNLALGKERFARAVANMGLEDERAARAVADRAKASLDNIKAAQEIQNISQDQLLKALQIVKLLEGFSRQEEEKIKDDDISLSAQADQPMATQLMGGQQQPMENDMQAQQLAQQTPPQGGML
jgi:hypothetical protein